MRTLCLSVLLAAACSGAPNPTEEQALAVGPGPDWVVRSIEAPPSADGAFTARVTACNEGDSYAAGAALELYVSTDTTIDPGSPPFDDVAVGAGWVDGLDVGGCRSVDVPSWGAPLQGAAYLAAIIDPGDTVFEGSESNNVFVGPLMGFGYGPDLRVTAIAAPPSAQGNFSVEVTVCNTGTAYAWSANVELYVTIDEVLDLGPPPGGDFPVGAGQIYGLSPGQCTPVSIFAWAPPMPQTAAYLAAIVDPQDSVLELIESNNSLLGPLTGFGFGPDLVVASVLAPPSANGPFIANVRVCNQGTDSASGVPVELYASDDAELDVGSPPAGDVPLGVGFTQGLASGECADLAIEAYPPPLRGTAAYIAALVDPTDSAPELIESNNARVGALTGFGSGPDLIVSAIDAPPSAANTFEAIVTVCNQGTAPAYGASVVLLASTDDVVEAGPWPAGDPALGFAWVNMLMEGQCEAVHVAAWAPPLAESAAYLGAVVDESDAVFELIETNNTYLGALTGFGYGPDLIVADVQAPPAIDGPFTLQVTVCNQGTQDAPSAMVDLFVSTDARVSADPPPTGDVYIASGAINYLPAGACQTLDVPAWGPPPFMQTAGYLVARVDAQEAISELIESNNDGASGLTGFGYGPDAIVSAISAPPSADGPFQAQVLVCNQGTAPMSDAQVELYASTDMTLSPFPPPAGDPWIGNASVPALDAGQCALVTVNAWSPPLPSGPAYLIAAVDPQGAQPELIETNNSFVGAQMGFGYGPDLIVSSVVGPPSAAGSFDVQVTVCNQGTAPAPGGEVEMYASADANIRSGPSGDFFLGSAWFASLDAGACQTVTTLAWAPPLQGGAYLGAIVDGPQSVQELIESNNTTVGALTGFGYGPDLVVDSLSAAPYVMPGGQLSVLYTVCNRGTDFAPSSELGLLAASTPSAPVGPNSPYFPLWIPGLPAGDCTSGETTVGVPLNLGAAYVVASIDVGDGVTELIESNNRGADGFEVAILYCGNGAQESGEACDDGNFSDGDGCSASCEVEYHAVWQENADGTLHTNVGWNYAMGHHFTPQLSGYITAIGGYFNGTKVVRLFDRDSGALLTQALVTANNSWSYVDVAAIAVQAGRRYTVAVYLAGSGGSYRTGVSRFPRTLGDVRIDGSTYVSTSGGASSARPTNTVTTVMYGQADVRFSRYP